MDKCWKTIEHNQFEADEITASGLTAEPATSVNAPRIAECFLNIECEFVWEQELAPGDSSCAVVCVKAVRVCMDSEYYDESKTGRYGKTGFVYTTGARNPDTGEIYNGGFAGMSDEFREESKRIHRSFWDAESFGDDMFLCPGCFNKKDSKKCGKLKHARKQGLSSCLECGNFPCGDCGHVNIQIHPREAGSVVSAEVITWALLPYVGGLN